jgi:uncharacterized protein YggE
VTKLVLAALLVAALLRTIHGVKQQESGNFQVEFTTSAQGAQVIASQLAMLLLGLVLTVQGMKVVVL